MINLQGKTALITGGSRGIGRATAILLARAGSEVAISYTRHKKQAEEVAFEIAQLGGKCLVLKGNISKKSDVDQIVDKTIKEYGKIDILVNNAGIWTYGEIGNMTEQLWEETMNINLKGIFLTCNTVVPYMKKRKMGWIINVSSTAGLRGEAFHSHYAASKGGIISFTKSLAVELAPYNILVNCVAPGWVDTDMCQEVFKDKEFREQIRQSIPLKRIPLAEDIAGVILFLASDLARHITGAVINVSGGTVLWP
ncbi:MAG: SDR family NAD(P)-dependent oxidoreductase [Candidatus Aminicenantia bacterium]